MASPSYASPLSAGLSVSPWRRAVPAAALAASIVVAGLLSIARGQDTNWDMQNYHFYNPWAFLHGRGLTFDLAAAQLQTYHSPFLDLPFYWMVAADWPPALIAFALAVPTGIAAFFLIRLAWFMFADLDSRARLAATGAASVIGLTAAVATGVIGTTMNEWPGAMFVIIALWWVGREIAAAPKAPLKTSILVTAGVLCGIASGLKLTVATFAVTFCLTLLGRVAWRAPKWREAALFAAGTAAGFLVAYGPWGWQLWSDFRNPVFPYGNQWFHSPWWEPNSPFPRVYGPHSLLEWLLFPFTLLAPPPFYVTEPKYVDARMPLIYALSLMALASACLGPIARRVGGRGDTPAPAIAPSVAPLWRFVTLFFALSFVLWTAQHSVYRYLVPLELLSGILIIGLLRYLLRPGVVAAGVAVATIGLLVTTEPAEWGRTSFGTQWFDVPIPRVEANALVLLASDAPMSYLLPYFPPDARHVGVDNSITRPSSKTGLEDRIVEVIEKHQGPIYALSFPKGAGTRTLRAHGLARIPSTCTTLPSKLTVDTPDLCRLERTFTPAR